MGSSAIIRGSEEEERLKSMPIVLEEVPRWVEGVPGLEEALVVPGGDRSVREGGYRSPRFLGMNVVVSRSHVLFV
jgi:hypothetical protein